MSQKSNYFNLNLANKGSILVKFLYFHRDTFEENYFDGASRKRKKFYVLKCLYLSVQFELPRTLRCLQVKLVLPCFKPYKKFQTLGTLWGQMRQLLFAQSEADFHIRACYIVLQIDQSLNQR
jgi:hypothetical protein